MNKKQLEQDFKKTSDDYAYWHEKYTYEENAYLRAETKKMVDALEKEFKYLGSRLFNQGDSANG